MKNYKVSFYILAAFILLTAALSGCAAKTYEAEKYGNADIASDEKFESVGQIVINGIDYETVGESIVISELTNEKYSRCEVKSEGVYKTDQTHTVDIDPATGSVKSFMGIAPYEPIKDIKSLSDASIKAECENRLSDLTDFIQYDSFDLVEVKYDGKNTNGYSLTWSEEKDFPRNNIINVMLDADGVIYYYSKTSACPEYLSVPKITDKEAEALLLETANEKSTLQNQIVSVKINNKTLSLYRGNAAIIYSVDVADTEGFTENLSIVIYEKS